MSVIGAISTPAPQAGDPFATRHRFYDIGHGIPPPPRVSLRMQRSMPAGIGAGRTDEIDPMRTLETKFDNE